MLRLDRSDREPLRRQLETMLREAMRAGRLAAGTRLPSSRDLAKQLGVSRGVVVDAYAALQAQGFLRVRSRAAPRVASRPDPATDEPAQEAPPIPPPPRFDFVPTTPDVSFIDRRAWLRALERSLRAAPDAAFDYGDMRGDRGLREGLVDYLGRVRGVVATPSQAVVVQGFTQAIDIAFREIAATGGRRIAFEDPCYDDQWDSARRAGLEPVPIPVDEGGIRVEALVAADPDAVVLTPAHQLPTGAVLESSRRRAIVAWAADRDALVIEDDYDSEFRYDRAPVGTLQGLDPNRVLYVGTISKTVAPGLRLGWSVVPPTLLDRFVEAKRFADAGSPVLEQLALADLLRSGAYERTIQRARILYRRRRDALLEALDAYLPSCSVGGIAAGLHVLLRLPPSLDAAAVAAAANARRVRLRPLTDFSRVQQTTSQPALVLGYGRLPEPAIGPAVRALAEAIESVEAKRAGSKSAAA